MQLQKTVVITMHNQLILNPSLTTKSTQAHLAARFLAEFGVCKKDIGDLLGDVIGSKNNKVPEYGEMKAMCEGTVRYQSSKKSPQSFVDSKISYLMASHFLSIYRHIGGSDVFNYCCLETLRSAYISYRRVIVESDMHCEFNLGMAYKLAKTLLPGEGGVLENCNHCHVERFILLGTRNKVFNHCPFCEHENTMCKKQTTSIFAANAQLFAKTA